VTKSKNTHSKGSNQYQQRGMSKTLTALTVPTLTISKDVERRRCGEVWGLKCRAWVSAPDYAHGNHPSTIMRYSVAENPNTPIDTLIKLTRDADTWVRRQAAKNPNVPVAVLVRLAEDDNTVRYAVAQNPNVPIEALTKLGGDIKWFVRRTVAMHPNAPIDSLIKLAWDDDDTVREAARKNVNLPENVRAMIALSD